VAQEDDIAIGVMQIAAAQSSSICTFKRAYLEIPNFVNLSRANLAPSIKRPGEPMWHQIVRNIKSHNNAVFIGGGLLVHVPRIGYELTTKGLKFLKAKGFI
jgi:hypothetical protein